MFFKILPDDFSLPTLGLFLLLLLLLVVEVVEDGDDGFGELTETGEVDLLSFCCSFLLFFLVSSEKDSLVVSLL